MSAPTSGQAADVAWFAARDMGADDAACWDAAAQAALKVSPEYTGALARIATAERFCRVVLARDPECGAVETTARAVLAYLSGEPMASPETSAGVIARIPASDEENGVPGDRRY